MNSEKVSHMTRKLILHEPKKNYLRILKLLEDIRSDTDMTEEQFLEYRKIILDNGNDTLRRIDQYLSTVKMIYAGKDKPYGKNKNNHQ